MTLTPKNYTCICMKKVKSKSTTNLPLTVIIFAHRQDERLRQAEASAQQAQQVLVVHPGGQVTDFSRIRNEALQLVQHDWVFFLDSDEVITPESWSEIKKILSDEAVAGAWVKRQDYYFGKLMRWGEVGQVALLRLVRRSAVKFSRPVHEVAEVQGATIHTHITLHHFSHSSCTEFLSKVSLYAQLEAKYRSDQGQRFSWSQLVVYPLAKWWLNGLFRLGFLDGWRGMTYVVCMTIHSLLVRVYLYEFENNR